MSEILDKISLKKKAAALNVYDAAA